MSHMHAPPCHACREGRGGHLGTRGIGWYGPIWKLPRHPACKLSLLVRLLPQEPRGRPQVAVGTKTLSLLNVPGPDPAATSRFRSAFFVELHGGRCRCVCASGGCVMQSRAHWPTSESSVGNKAAHGFADAMHFAWRQMLVACCALLNYTRHRCVGGRPGMGPEAAVAPLTTDRWTSSP